MPASAAAALGLVGDQHDGLAERAQQLGEMAVERRQAGAGIDDEQADVGRADRGLGLRAHAAGERIRRGLVEAGGVDGGEFEPADAGLALAPVAGDARQVVDQRQPLADEPVEQRRLADIRPTDDGDAERPSAGGHGHPRVRPAGRRPRSRLTTWRAPAASPMRAAIRESITWARWRRSAGDSWSLSISSKYLRAAS